MPEISPLGNPSIDDIERAGKQRLARSADDKAANTADARLLFFLNYVECHGRSHNYLTVDVERILFTYTTWLLSGNSIKATDTKPFYIKVGTIKGYLGEVNKHYASHAEPPPYDSRVKSRTKELLDEAAKYEDECIKRAPLSDAVVARAYELAEEENDRHGFRTIVWHFINIGRFAGLRRQEYAMEKEDTIQYYQLPSGQLVARAFLVEDVRFCFEGGVETPRLTELSNDDRDQCVAAGLLYKIQKNRQNRQLQWYNRNRSYPRFCFVNSAFHLVDNALYLGQAWDEPLCVYKAGDVTKMLTGLQMTEYLRFITLLVFPRISTSELNRISSHSIRVYAACLLHEAGKDAAYIKLRLRWLSDCFLGYLRNTNTIREQHNDALDSAHTTMMKCLRFVLSDLPEIPAIGGPVDLSFPDLEDED